MHNTDSKKTDFGFEQVAWDEKTTRVKEVFRSVANKYDLMNDVMSLGIHRCWKQAAIHRCRIRSGHHVLDLAGGSGDLTRKISPLVGKHGSVVLADINNAMLHVGRGRLLDEGIFENICFVQANAEHLPFDANYFDRIIIGFGLRNVTDKNQALRAMYRVLKPGGRLIILEFSTPTSIPLKKIYDTYSFKVLPKLGAFIAQDEESYRYLVESIRMHPDQKTLLNMMQQAGFEDVDFHNLTGGIVALHRGYKYG